MASPTIKIKRSSIAGKVPHYPTTLDVGEFAINTADGKVFIAAGVGAGVTVREVGISTAQVLASGIGTFSSLVITDEGHAIAGLSTGSARVETATDAGNQWHHVGFFDHRTGYQKVKTNGLTYNPNTGKLYAGIGSFGSASANIHGFSGNVNSTGISTISGFTFPSTDGSEDQALVTDGNGSLSFKTLSGGGGAVGGATTISASNTIATQGQTAFTAPNVFDDGEQATAFSVLVTLNGMKMRLGGSQDYTLSAPQTVNFTSGVNVGDNLQISVYFGHTFEEELFTSTQNQATFTLAGSLAAAKNYRVFLNGVRLRRDVDYQASAAVVLAQNCASGDEVDICSDQAEDQLTASDGQSAFAPSNSDTSSDNMEVYLNGVLLQKTVDWTIGNPAVTIINPATGLDVGDELDVVVRRS